jgi:carbon monoxide dehydrogenase subunit G
MDLKGEYRIPAPRDQVWAMLNDPAVLRECIPGCETLEGSPGEGFSARVTTKIGPVKATFNGSVSLTNVNPPESYTISGEGKGGVAGFAKGGADVHLAADGTDTVLTYVAKAQVGGKLAQLGSRLIDSTAKKLADQFFACFAERAGTPATSGAATMPAAVEPALVMPGAPIPPAATGVPIVEGQAAEPETVPPLAASTPRADVSPGVAPMHHGMAASVEPPATAHTNAPGHTIQEAAHEVEEEVEAKAAMGFLGGPIVWGLLVILALLFVYVIAT